MRYLVTGGCGFIGSHLCDQLLKLGHDVVVLDNLSTGTLDYLNRRIKLVVGSVCDRPLLERLLQDVDGCFHLAAIASVQACTENWSGCHRVNQTGTIHIFEALKQRKIPVVYASSAAVYGDSTALPLSEKQPARPISAYGADKLGGEQHASVAAHERGISSVGLRFFNVYGPRQNPLSPYSGVISVFTRCIQQHQELTLHGDGQQSRDFIYVGDIATILVSAMEYAADHPGAEVVNACTGQATSLLQLIEQLSELADYTPTVNSAPARMSDIRKSVGNPGKLHRLMKFQPGVDLEEGLRRLMMSDQCPPSVVKGLRTSCTQGF